MAKELVEILAHRLAQHYVRAVETTEIVALRVDRAEGGQRTLSPIVHIRPDDCDDATRREAIRAFEDVMSDCIDRGLPGSICVGDLEKYRQYCLILPLTDAGETRLAFGLIVRARDDEDARKKLSTVLEYRLRPGPHRARWRLWWGRIWGRRRGRTRGRGEGGGGGRVS